MEVIVRASQWRKAARTDARASIHISPCYAAGKKR